MKLTATFRALDDAADEYTVGTVTWDGRAATADPPDNALLADAARSVQAWHDPAAAMRELPRLFGTAYLRADLTEND